MEKHKDETELMDKHGAIDFNNHQDVFYSLYSKVPIKHARKNTRFSCWKKPFFEIINICEMILMALAKLFQIDKFLFYFYL